MFTSIFRRSAKSGNSALLSAERIINAVGTAMFLTDEQLTITHISDAALNALGYRRDEVVGKMSCADLCKTSICKTEDCTIRRCMRSGKSITGEVEATTRDGRKIPIAAICSAIFDDQGTPIGGMEVIFDQSEQKLALDEVARLIDASIRGQLDSRGDTSRFKGDHADLIAGINKTIDTLVSHIDAIPAPAMIIDKEFNIQFINQAGAGVLGKTPQSLKNQKCYDQFRTSDCKTSKCALGRSMHSGKQEHSETDAHPNGLDLEIAYTGVPIRDKNGEIIGALEIVQDQTDIKRSQRRMENVASYQKNEIEKISSVLNHMSKGDFTCQYMVTQADEETKDVFESFNKLQKDLNATLSSLNEILTTFKISVDQVTVGASQVSDASQSLSQGATEQAGSLEEISASMQEMADRTRQNADNSSRANELSTESRKNADIGNQQMQEMLSAINEISSSSQNIGKIIKVIDEIAFQTNLLALNAAVEAARAGVHGKGFAVVAEEVRNLAQRSARAAKETTELIEGSVRSVEAGTQIADSTAKALENIVDGVSKVTALIGEIADASKEQSIGIEQVSTGLGQIEQVTQSNTASAEQSAAAAEELSSQSTQLKYMLNRFVLKDEGHSRGPVVRSDEAENENGWQQFSGSGSSGKDKKSPALGASSLDDIDFDNF